MRILYAYDVAVLEETGIQFEISPECGQITALN
jgi:hypothetical protein